MYKCIYGCYKILCMTTPWNLKVVVQEDVIVPFKCLKYCSLYHE